jgi:hypothetical protein
MEPSRLILLLPKVQLNLLQSSFDMMHLVEECGETVDCVVKLWIVCVDE